MRFESEISLEENRETEFESPAAGKWVDSPEQLAFRERVLNAHIDRSRKIKGPPLPDLTRKETARVAGTDLWMRKGAAEAAGRLLAAANRDLQKARAAGHADALRTIRLTGVSGYRGSTHQRQLWRRYFKAYYESTAAAREKLAGGPHSVAAVSYMLNVFGIPNRIAAPGYSNHQAGIAIDFAQQRTPGNRIINSYNASAKTKWRSTWFFDWLTSHAASFGFQPYIKEPWHWEHRSASRRQQETGSLFESGQRRTAPVRRLAGQIISFTLSSLPVRVAVYCPKEAAGQSAVDVVLYAHGLNGGQCGEPAKTPQDFITGSVFGFGRIIDESRSGAVLVVPFLDWEHLAQRKLGFGPKDRRGAPRWHKLAIPANVNQLVREALAGIGQATGSGAPSLRRLIIAGHSRAYDFLDPLANRFADPDMSKEALAKLSEIWAFDTSYSCPIGDWQRWLDSKPRLRMRLFYRPGSPTEGCGRAFAAAASKPGSRISKPIPVREVHCAVPGRRLPALLSSLAPKSALTPSPAPEYQFEQEAISPVVGRLCAISARIAADTRGALQVLRTNGAGQTWRAEAIRERAASQVNRMSREIARRLTQFNGREIDLLTGCLSRVEHAIGRETLPMRKFRAVARERLKAFAAGIH
jgi:LAS superfamily LD-carboxypeptidase LdcB